MSSTEEIPSAEQLLITSVETELGPREIRFYWGDVATLIKGDSIVVISTSCFQPKITGMAWKKILEKFPNIEKWEPEFKEVIVSSPSSSLWPMSAEDHLRCSKYADDEKCRFPPAILVSPKMNDVDFKRLFVVRALPGEKPKDDGTALTEKYQNMVETCFPAIKAVEAEEQMCSAKPDAYEHLVLTALAGRQRYEIGGKSESFSLVFQSLHKAAASWLRASPWWRSVDIVCWDPAQDKEEVSGNLRKSFCLETGAREPSPSLKCLHDEVKEELQSLKIAFVPANGFRGADYTALREEIERLDKVLRRPLDELLVKEVGSAAGTLAEALVKWLAKDFFGPGIALRKTFEKNIELLGETKENKPKLSSWVQSYLHNLRILRNKSAHAADSDEKNSSALPRNLADEDLTVLFASLKSVLRLHRDWIREKIHN